MDPTASFGCGKHFYEVVFVKKLMIFLSYALVAAIAAAAATATAENKAAEQVNKLDELTQIIQTYFIGEPDLDAMENAAASAMVEALDDRWSYYMDAEEYSAYLERMANVYVGIGASVSLEEDGYIHISGVEPGSPAEEMGVLPGDVIVAAEGQDIHGMSLNEASAIIRGPEGTQVNLTLRRGDQEISVTLTRRRIHMAVASGQMLADQIGLIQISNFDDRCAEETIGAVEELLAQGAEALIFDVRFNPGGYKNELVKILDYLLPEGPLFRSINYAGKETVDQSDSKYLDIPMAVLMNGDSYSAAEFFAAALSEYDAAVMVGQHTTGKGYFQSAIELSDGSAAVISIGKYTTPNGVSLAGVGLTPDITVEVDDNMYLQLYYGIVPPEKDPQIQAAISALKVG